MNLYAVIYILILIQISHSKCDNLVLHKKVEQINNRIKQLYGEMSEKDEEYYDLKTLNVDTLLYPRDDKKKLLLLSTLWREYYKCSLRSVDNLTRHRQVPSVMLMVYTGAVGRLQCAICVPPAGSGNLLWFYAKSQNNTFSLMQDNERIVRDKENLTIYSVKEEDDGIYKCQLGNSESIVVLEVVDDDPYNVVKPLTSRGPYATQPVSLDNGLSVYISWSPWSECSVCKKVGRRHRYGLCYVRLDRTNMNSTNSSLDSKELALFEVFPTGFPCRSKYLPSRLKSIDAIQQRRNEIMIAMCKVACDDIIFHARTVNGEIVETANNTASIYSLTQILPKQPPIPIKTTVFVDFGQRISIRCPGTILRDAPIVWRCGTKVIVPKELYKQSGGRMYINPRDHLVITTVLYRDANLYSCSAQSRTCGGVSLVVSRGGGCWPRRVALLAQGIIALAVLRAIHKCRAAIH